MDLAPHVLRVVDREAGLGEVVQPDAVCADEFASVFPSVIPDVVVDESLQLAEHHLENLHLGGMVPLIHGAAGGIELLVGVRIDLDAAVVVVDGNDLLGHCYLLWEVERARLPGHILADFSVFVKYAQESANSVILEPC